MQRRNMVGIKPTTLQLYGKRYKLLATNMPPNLPFSVCRLLALRLLLLCLIANIIFKTVKCIVGPIKQANTNKSKNKQSKLTAGLAFR